MKKLLALTLVTIIASTPVSAAPTTDGECKDLYPLTGIVTEVEHMEDTDLITMTTAIMNSNGTDEVYDDEIVDAHYTGTLDQLSQYTA